jgi:hypothetical protein
MVIGAPKYRIEKLIATIRNSASIVSISRSQY